MTQYDADLLIGGGPAELASLDVDLGGMPLRVSPI
jgi:hypothetical protein